MLKAVIFDMDGVIIDSEPLHARAGVLGLKNLGISIPEDYCYQFIGNTTKYMMEEIIKKYHLTNSLEELLAANDAAKKHLIEKEGYPPIPFIREFIIDLYEHGVALAIPSSSPMEAILRTVETLELTPYFSHLISGMELKRSKPDPAIFLLALDKLGVSADECLVIEDSYHGVCAAHAALIPCIGFLNPNSGNQNLSKASILVEGFEEVTYEFASNVLKRHIGEPITIATTNRLLIRELSLSDMPQMHSIYKEESINRFVTDTDTSLEEAIQQQDAYIKNIYHFFGYGYWGVFLKDTNTLIGRCGIQNKEIEDSIEIELGYFISERYQRKGYAFEACQSVLSYAKQSLEISSVVAVIDVTNLTSQSLAKKLGMHVTSEIMRDGRSCYVYRIFL